MDEDQIVVDAPEEAPPAETPDTRAETKFKRSSVTAVSRRAKKAGVSSTTVSKAINPELEEDLKIGTLMSVLDAIDGDIEVRVLRNGRPMVETIHDVDIL